MSRDRRLSKQLL